MVFSTTRKHSGAINNRAIIPTPTNIQSYKDISVFTLQNVTQPIASTIECKTCNKNKGVIYR